MSRRRRRKVIFKTYLEYLVIAVGLALILRMTVVSPYKMPSDSMNPVLQRGDFVFAYTLPFGIHSPLSEKKWGNSILPRKGDVVLYRYELDKKSLFIKRVLGLPGDKVEISQGKLLINEKVEKEFPFDSNLKPFLVPQDSVFLIADNPMKSDDLQYWSIVSKERVLGLIKWVWLSVDQDTNMIRWNRILETIL